MFFTYFHELVYNIFSEVSNRPFPNFKIIFNMKNLIKHATSFFANFFYGFCVVFEEV